MTSSCLTPQKRAFRALTGVLLLDKPAGVSSNAALQRARRLFRAQKAGHAGTLDPFASGLLPIAFGEATKLLQFSLASHKKYRATLCLGKTTETGDPEGSVIEEREVSGITRQQAAEVLASMLGKSLQQPPMYSALKFQGKPLYEYARAGIEIPRESREIEIFSLEMIDFSLPFLTFEALVSKGTYIRTLAEDIGKQLNCGAYLTALRRTQNGELSLARAHTFEALEATVLSPHDGANAFDDPSHALLSRLLPPDALLNDIPTIPISQSLSIRFQQGQRIKREDLDPACPFSSREGARLILTHENRILGVAEIKNGIINPLRVLNAY